MRWWPRLRANFLPWLARRDCKFSTSTARTQSPTTPICSPPTASTKSSGIRIITSTPSANLRENCMSSPLLPLALARRLARPTQSPAQGTSLFYQECKQKPPRRIDLAGASQITALEFAVLQIAALEFAVLQIAVLEFANSRKL